jgi:mannosyltransferase OCH1-like enzyme
MKKTSLKMVYLDPDTLLELENGIKDFLTKQAKQLPFPKIIHQVWHSPEEREGKTDKVPIPNKWTEGPEAIKKLHPDWLHVLWRVDISDKFVQKYEPKFYKTYKNYPYFIQRCDAVRYCFLKHFGGLYLDLDWVPLENIDKHIDTDSPLYFVPSSNTSGCYTNAIIASKPGLSFWDDVLVACTKDSGWYNVTQILEVMYTTGPKMLTEQINNYNGGFCTLPTIKFNPVSYDDIINGQTTKEGAICRSLKGASWHTWDTAVLSLAYDYKWYVVTFIVLMVLISIVWVGYYYRIGRLKSLEVNPFADLEYIS